MNKGIGREEEGRKRRQRRVPRERFAIGNTESLTAHLVGNGFHFGFEQEVS